jgi:hypothetical protein
VAVSPLVPQQPESLALVPVWLLKLLSVLESLMPVPVWLLKLPSVLESLMPVPVWLPKLLSVLEWLMATTSGISIRGPRQ